MLLSALGDGSEALRVAVYAVDHPEVSLHIRLNRALYGNLFWHWDGDDLIFIAPDKIFISTDGKYELRP